MVEPEYRGAADGSFEANRVSVGRDGLPPPMCKLRRSAE